MRRAPRHLVAAVLVAVAVLATSASPASADVWTNDYFDNSGYVCIQGVNGAVVVAGGLRFKSETRSFELDCTTPRPLSPGDIKSSTGVRSLDWTTGLFTNCGFVKVGYNGNGGGGSLATPGTITLMNDEMRELCGIPAGHTATAGAYSDHSAVIFGSFLQTGRVIGNQAAAI